MVNLTISQKTEACFLNDFEIFSVKGNFRTGVSNCFTGIDCFSIYHQQSVMAVVAGMEVSPKNFIYKFEEYAIDYILRNMEKSFPSVLICHPIIRKITDYDKKNNTAYLRTLQLYLDNQMNAVETAKKLFIHRSTMNFRLKRLEELCAINWDDSILILYLRLALKV